MLPMENELILSNQQNEARLGTGSGSYILFFIEISRTQDGFFLKLLKNTGSFTWTKED